jgi:hypothetical protein
MANKLVWARVMRPRAPLVYLDLNHFIYLARVDAGDESVPGGYRELRAAARSAVCDRRAVFPLSSAHLWEMAAIKDQRQRKSVADMMEELSGFYYLLGRPKIAQLGIEAGIEDVLDETSPLLPFPLIRPTFGWAFGMRGGVTIRDENGEDASEAARDEMGAERFDQFMRFANHTLERQILEGPSDEEIPILREQYGYAPEVLREGHGSRLAFELELSDRLQEDPRWRRGRLRDVVSGREIAHEWLDAINRVNEDRAGENRPVLTFGDDRVRQFMAAMPHSQVAISIKTRYHRDPGHHWTTNDITDIDAVSVAYAYCDVVFTDKAIRAALANSKELRAIPTFLPRTPTELAEWLDQQPPLAIPDMLVPHPPRGNPGTRRHESAG